MKQRRHPFVCVREGEGGEDGRGGQKHNVRARERISSARQRVSLTRKGVGNKKGKRITKREKRI
jgi:hypothetical protein